MRTRILPLVLLICGGGAHTVASQSSVVSADTEAMSAVSIVAAPFQDRLYHDPRDYGSRYGDLDVRIWMDSDRDVFRSGDRSRVRLRLNDDAYVAVIHIDTNGDLEFVYPTSSYSDGFLRGGRSYSVPTRGGSGYFTVRGTPGIGYFYAVASERPLNLRAFRESFSAHRGGWDRERNVLGDPFYTLERITRRLVGEREYGYHAEDVYSYHVGRRYRYPRYACYDSYGPWYGSRSYDYRGCDRVQGLLYRDPYYYDGRHYRDQRRVYVSRPRSEPEHRYKEPSRGGSTGSAPPLRRPQASEGSTVAADQERPARPAATERQRPTLQRRPAVTAPEAAPRPSAREDARRRGEPARREEPPRREEPARREEPRREAPPQRVEGRRSSESQERTSAPARSEPRVRP